MGIGQQRIPQPHSILDIEFLAEKEHEPAERIELVVNLIALDDFAYIWICYFKYVAIKFYLSGNATIFFVEFAEEAVSKFYHDVAEGVKQV